MTAMMCMTLATLLLTVLCAGIVIRRRRGLPESVSAMVYDLPRQGQWLWTLWIWAVSLLTCIPLVDTMPSGLGGIGFITLACLMLCGAMPISDNSVSHRAHNAFGILGGILSQVCVAVICPDWLFAWALWVFLMGSVYVQPEGWLGRMMSGKGVFLAEMICTVTVCGSLLVRLASAS